jgi:hypothetical protein
MTATGKSCSMSGDRRDSWRDAPDFGYNLYMNGGEASISLPPNLAAPAEAREFLRSHIATDDDVMDSLVLGVSELVTNAVVHAGTDITVTVRQLSQAIRVEVGDLDPRLPQGREVSIDADSGRGLSIIEGFGLRWGAKGRAPGKTVWIEADTAPAK